MSEKKNITQAAGVLGVATVLSRVMGMIRDMVVSRLFGAGFATDAFFAAYQIPNMLRRFFAEGALTSAFVPIFSESLSRHGKDDARNLANVCFTLLTIVMAGITLTGIFFSPQIVGLMFPGFKMVPAKLEMTVFLNRLMFPYIFFISLVALCMGILNSARHFFTPAISTVFLNIAMILSAWMLHDYFEAPITALAFGVLLGGLLQLLLQLPVLYRLGFPLRPSFSFDHPAVRRITLLMGPSIFGVGVYYLNITVGNILASLLPQGSVSYLYYAQRLFEFPQGVFTVSIAQAVLPSMSRQAAEGDIGALKESLAFGMRLTIFITVPAMTGLILCATPIFSLLFMGGEFDYAKARHCAEALVYYSVGLSFVALVRVIVPAFYAMKDTRTPVMTAFVAFWVNLAFSLMLMRPMLHGGLALASTVAAMCNLFLLIMLLRRKIGPFGGRGIFMCGVKAIVASLPVALITFWGMNCVDWSMTGGKPLKVMLMTVTVVVSVLLYLATAWGLKCSEAHDLVGLIRKRLGRSEG